MRFYFLLFNLFFISFLNAQVPSLSVKRGSGDNALTLAKLDVSVEIVGNMAYTTYDMVFYNPYNKTLQGDFEAPMKEGQEIVGYALDVNGKLREGVVVEKVKARQTYEAVVNRQIDPGLINKTKGNNFSTKIYPIPAKGNKRVQIAFSETLNGNADELFYELPIKDKRIIKSFSLQVKVLKGKLGNQPINTNSQNIRFDNTEEAHLMRLQKENYTFQEPIKFSVPKFPSKNEQVFTYTMNGETYFYVVMQPKSFKAKAKKQPNSLAIYWDNSFSSKSRNWAKELQLLKKYLQTLSPNTKVAVAAFNINLGTPTNFTASQSDRVIDHIRTFNKDGATLFQNLQVPKDVDEVLMFSDGVQTIGTESFTSEGAAVYTISSSTGSNYGFLNKISALSNAEFINLSRLSIEESLGVLTSNKLKFLGADYAKSSIKEVYPKTAQTVTGYFELSGILTANQSDITVNFGDKNKVLQSKRIKIEPSQESSRVRHIWATKKIAYLDLAHEENREQILAMSKKHKIVTRNTAMLVLDRIEDYVTHEVEPPQELKEEYDRLLAQKQKQLSPVSKQDLLAQNLEIFNSILTWYNTDFTEETLTRPKTIPAIVRVSSESLEDSAMDEMQQLDAEPSLEEVVVIGNSNSNTSKEKKAETPKKSTIKVLAWLPDAAYMKKLRAAEHSKQLELYYDLKKENETRPAFYIQVADFFFKQGKKNLARRILSNCLEMELENPELLKSVAKQFLNEGEKEYAIAIFEEIKLLRPEEPQSYRDLALAYEQNGECQKALDMYLHILDNFWPRFDNIKLVVLNEFNHFLTRYQSKLDLRSVPKQYLEPIPQDIRIVMEWSSNNNDIDLWVVDPNGEKCFFRNNRTKIGGRITHDFTRGYGPEAFSLKKAKRGLYTVYANYYSESRQTITGPVTVYATMITNYGRANEEAKKITFQVENSSGKTSMQIGQLEF